MELPMFLLSTIQTRPSNANGSFYLFEPIDSIKASSIRKALFSREAKVSYMVFASFLKFQVALFIGSGSFSGRVTIAVEIVGFSFCF
jgi:hypothetical protein